MSREQIAIFAVMNAFLLPGVFFGAALCRGKGRYPAPAGRVP